ncbi:MAG TPA: hypothetical protein VHD33_06435, partial [Legionellaceae bacterium]|nr:hypothetical protein [Legionellaceae bacterium]
MLFKRNHSNISHHCTNHCNERSACWQNIYVLIPFVFIVFAIWLPFGFSLTGLIEEWGVLGIYAKQGLSFIASPTGAWSPHALRPLTILPQGLAYWLDANSFFYWHILLIIALIFKGGALSLLMWQVTHSRRWSIFAGLVVVLYPADTMQLAFRAIHINWALTFLLMASAVFIIAAHLRQGRRSLMWGCLSAILLLVSLSMYEASLSLVLLPFLMIYVKEGVRSSIQYWRTRKKLIFIWLLSIIIYLVYAALVASTITSYQHSLIGHLNLWDILRVNYFYLLNPGMLHGFLGGWIEAISILLKEMSGWGYIYLLAIITILFAILHCILKIGHSNDKNNSIGLITRLLLVGVLLIILGFAPYLLSYSHLLINQRTYLFIAPGAALFWTAILMILAQWQKTIALIFAFIMLFLGLGMQVFQFHHYVKISETQRGLLRSIIENFSSESHQKNLILLDESNQLSHTWMFIASNLQFAMDYFYGTVAPNIEIC